jgi:lysophospholipase L1-like esterase
VQARQAVVNDAIQAKTTGHDETADSTATVIGDASDGSNGTYYYDRLHLTNAGYALLATATETPLGACGIT